MIDIKKLSEQADWGVTSSVKGDELETLIDVAVRADRELEAMERWAGQQNAGNAFAQQVRFWALSQREKLHAGIKF